MDRLSECEPTLAELKTLQGSEGAEGRFFHRLDNGSRRISKDAPRKTDIAILKAEELEQPPEKLHSYD